MTRPSGVPRPQIVAPAAIALARIAGGIRSVKIEWIVGLQIPFPSPLTSTAANIAQAPTSSVSTQSGIAWRGTDIAISRKPSTLWEKKRNDRKFPISAPAPNPAKRAPAILASAPKRSIVSTGTAAKNACHAASPATKSGIQIRRSRSLTRKRRPTRMPPVSSSASSWGTGSGFGTNRATSANETR